MELRYILSILRKRALLILLACVVGASMGWWLTPRDPEYVARSKIYVGSRLIETENNIELNESRSRALDRFILTFATMIDTERIAGLALDRTAVQMSPKAVVAATEARPVPLTQLLYVDVTHRNPSIAQGLANALADAFVEAVQTYEPGDAASAEGQLPSLPAYIFESAQLPTRPTPTNVARNMFLGAILGLTISAGASLAVAYLDMTLSTPDDIERHIELPVLGSIPRLTTIADGVTLRVNR